LSDPGVARPTFGESDLELLRIAVVNGVVRGLRGRYEVLRVENVRIEVPKIVQKHRIHVVDMETGGDVIPLDSQIAVIVSKENDPANTSPLCGVVETLVQGALKPESSLS
jgi:hypothetical protein